MIAKIIDALQAFDYFGESEAIEIAKGKHELVHTFKDAKVKILRKIKMLSHD